ncbi:unnamed protein product [Arctogadus glacialis]
MLGHKSTLNDVLILNSGVKVKEWSTVVSRRGARDGMVWALWSGRPLGIYCMSMGETPRADPGLSLLAGLGTPTDTPGVWGGWERKGFRGFPFLYVAQAMDKHCKR